MHPRYTLVQDHDRSWSVLTEAGLPLKLAGIPQTGLTQMEAEITITLLTPQPPQSEKPRSRWADLVSTKATAA